MQESSIKKTPLDIINYIVLFMYSMLFITMHSVLGKHGINFILWGDYLLGMALVTITLIRFAKLNPEDRKSWAKMRTLFFAYFIVRIITTIKVDFGISTMRAAFFEGIYFLALSELTVDFAFIKKYVMKILILMNFLLNLFNMVIYFFVGNDGGVPIRHVALVDSLEQYTYDFPCFVYHNINYMGVLTSFCVLIAAGLFIDEGKEFKNLSVKNKVVTIIYLAISIYSIWFSGSRAAILALIGAIVIWAVNNLILKWSGTKIVMVVMSITLAITAGIIGFIYAHWDTGLPYYGNNEMTELENKIDFESTSRYGIWKSSLYAAKENKYILFGIGSEANEKRARDAVTVEMYKKYSGGGEYVITDYSHPHNGYIAVLVCTGLLGALLMGAALYGKNKRSVNLKNGIWYVAVTYVLILNLVECVTPIQRKCITFIIMCILAAETKKRCI